MFLRNANTHLQIHTVSQPRDHTMYVKHYERLTRRILLLSFWFHHFFRTEFGGLSGTILEMYILPTEC